MDIEGNLNNRPLTYAESEGKEVLTPNMIMWGANAHTLQDDVGEDEVIKMSKRLKKDKQQPCQRFKKEYIYSLLENKRVNRKWCAVPEIGEITLVIGVGNNRGEWKKGRVRRHVKGRDDVERGGVLQHTSERQLHVLVRL